MFIFDVVVVVVITADAAATATTVVDKIITWRTTKNES